MHSLISKRHHSLTGAHAPSSARARPVIGGARRMAPPPPPLVASSSSSHEPSSSSSPSPTPAITKRALLLAGSMAGLGSVGAASAATTPTTPTTTPAGARPSTLAAAATTTTTTTTTTSSIETFELDARTGLARLRYSPTGYRTWMWEPPQDALLQQPQQRQGAGNGDGTDAATATATTTATATPPPPQIKINYAVAGPLGAPPVLLVHGYGASAYHYRYNLPALADKGFRVFACDLAGFGWSERSTELKYAQARAWARQLAAFVEGVVLPEYNNNNDTTTKVAIAGNSLGGYASMAAAAARPDLFRAVGLLNSAGPFEEQAPDDADPSTVAAFQKRALRSAEEIASAEGDVYRALDARQRSLEREAEVQARRSPLTSAAQRAGGSLARAAKRAALFFAFQKAKQPQQIRDVLGMVYASKDPLDDDLVDSIVAPTSDPRSARVFALINGLGAVGAPVPPPPLTVDAIVLRLRRFGLPLALIWGEKDPWITPRRARQILALAPEARYYGIAGAGHCPHDDAPSETNAALAEFFGAASAPSK